MGSNGKRTEPSGRPHAKPEAIPLHVLGSDGDDGLAFELNSLEEMTRAARAGYPHRHSFYQVLYLTAGAGCHVIDFVPDPVTPPCLYFVSPGQVHFWELEEPTAGKVLRFAPEFLLFASAGESPLDHLAFFHTTGEPPRLSLEAGDAALFSELIGGLEEEYLHAAFGRTSVLRAYLHVLLVQIQRRWRTRTQAVEDRASSLVRRFKKMLSERVLVDRTVSAYAEALGLSAGHLSDTVKAVTQRTAGALIREEVTTEAKRLLAHSDLSVAEIAYRLHFEDPSYFGRFFRRESGASPGGFRNSFREKYQTYR
ncbi:MAG: helix-turn-helix domain-containing protein [Deltaproteobacteria bacterium]|nr:helix-turn-helix domain-containing protein [Deltaproteobacteria bacterium]